MVHIGVQTSRWLSTQGTQALPASGWESEGDAGHTMLLKGAGNFEEATPLISFSDY